MYMTSFHLNKYIFILFMLTQQNKTSYSGKSAEDGDSNMREELNLMLSLHEILIKDMYIFLLLSDSKSD